MAQGPTLRKYGVQDTIPIKLYEVDGVDLRTDWTPAAADCELQKDGGDYVQCTNTAVAQDGTYSIVLTATEMEFAIGELKVVDAPTKVFLDEVFNIETYGNASAQHAMDFDEADGSQFVEAGGDGDHLIEAGGTGDQFSDLGGMSDAMKAEVQVEANDALVALDLDHLLNVADADDVADDSVIGKMASTDGDWSNFDEATDSLQSNRDHATTIKSDTAAILLDTGTDGVVISSATQNAIADAYLDRAAAVDGLTPRQVQAITMAAVSGELAGATTTEITIKNHDGTDTRIVATVDADGNRSVVAYTLTGIT